MNKQRKHTICLLLILTLAFIAGCSRSGEKAGFPEGLAELYIMDYFEDNEISYGDYNSCSFDVAHHVDTSSHMDSAVIDLTIEYNYATQYVSLPVWYQYQKSTDSWSCAREGSWSEPRLEIIEKKLEGDWFVEWFNDHFDITIDSVKSGVVDLDYLLFLEARGGLLEGSRICEISGSGKGTLTDCGTFATIKVPITLPDGYYCTSGIQDTSFTLHLDPQNGLTYGVIYDDVFYRR